MYQHVLLITICVLTSVKCDLLNVYIPVQVGSNKQRSMDSEMFNIVANEPNSVTLQFSIGLIPNEDDDMYIRLLYERVPYHKPANIAILDSPVIINFVNSNYTIFDIPRGKYIICVQLCEDQNSCDRGDVERSQCVETVVERRDTHSEKNL